MITETLPQEALRATEKQLYYLHRLTCQDTRDWELTMIEADLMIKECLARRRAKGERNGKKEISSIGTK
jgi:hypothetical protein